MFLVMASNTPRESITRPPVVESASPQDPGKRQVLMVGWLTDEDKERVSQPGLGGSPPGPAASLTWLPRRRRVVLGQGTRKISQPGRRTDERGLA